MMHRDIYASGLWCTVCDSFFEEDASTFSTLLAMQFFVGRQDVTYRGVEPGNFSCHLALCCVVLQETVFHVTWP